MGNQAVEKIKMRADVIIVVSPVIIVIFLVITAIFLAGGGSILSFYIEMVNNLYFPSIFWRWFEWLKTLKRDCLMRFFTPFFLKKFP